MVRAVRVAILSQRYILVAMHYLNLPVISVELQNEFWWGRWHAGYQVCDFRFTSCDVTGPDMLAISSDASDVTDCGPCCAHVFAERVGRQELNMALINASVTGLGLFAPLFEGEKSAR